MKFAILFQGLEELSNVYSFAKNALPEEAVQASNVHQKQLLEKKHG